MLRAYIAQREGFLVRLEGTNEEKNQISDWIRWAASTQIRLIPATVSAVTQNQPLRVEIKGFKTGHCLGVKSLADRVIAEQEGMSNVLKVSLQTTIYSLHDRDLWQS